MGRIDKRFDTMDKRFDSVDERLDFVDERFDSVNKRFDSVDERFSSVDKRFDLVEKKIEDEIHDLAVMTAKGFDDLAKRLDIHERVEKLEKKMAKVETTLNVHL